MRKYIKILFTLLLLLLLPVLLLKGSLAAQGVKNGLNLAYRVVLPSLFPAMVVAGMAGEFSEYIPLPISWSVWLTSHLCGFPSGIRILTRTYRRGLLSKQHALRLSACCANASPAFLVVYTGEKLLGDPKAGWFLLIAQTTVSFLIALFGGALKRTAPAPTSEKKMIRIITECFSSAAMGSLILSGYVAFFAMIASLLQNVPAFKYLYGFLEITGGLYPALYPAAAMLGFSGCAVLLQNAAYLSEENLSVHPMLLGKCIYMVGMPAVTFLLNLF